MSNLFGKIKRRIAAGSDPCRGCGYPFRGSGVRFLGKTYCEAGCIPAVYRRALRGYARREPA